MMMVHYKTLRLDTYIPTACVRSYTATAQVGLMEFLWSGANRGRKLQYKLYRCIQDSFCVPVVYMYNIVVPCTLVSTLIYLVHVQRRTLSLV